MEWNPHCYVSDDSKALYVSISLKTATEGLETLDRKFKTFIF